MEKGLLHRVSAAIPEWLRYHFLIKKMGTPFGIAVFAFIAVTMSYITVLLDYKLSFIIVAFVAIIIVCILCILYPFIGFYFTYIISIFIVLPERFIKAAAPMPTGLIPEYFSYLVLLGVVTKQTYRKEIDNKFWSNAITVWMLVILVYLLIQFFNPYMYGKLGWFNYFRKQVSFAAFFYISYCFLNSRKAIFTFTKFWIILATFEALYACKQQWFGLFNFEYEWLISNPKRYELFVNWGFIRKFGLLSDPAAAGILYSCTTILLLVLGLRSRKIKAQVIYYTLAVINFLAASYTGTRTGTLMIVGAVAFYCVMTLYEKRTMIFSAFFVFLLTFIMVVPIYNSVIINRIRSTFEGSKDPSALVRDINRKSIQPYVYKHPIGGGLFTTGFMGSVYNPGHPLAGFPTDSAYMLAMLEQGPIGLAFMLIFYFAILRTGIKYFYRSRDPDIQNLYIAHLVAIFSMMVAQFSQLAIGQYPSVLYIFSALAILLKLHKFDTASVPVASDKI